MGIVGQSQQASELRAEFEAFASHFDEWVTKRIGRHVHKDPLTAAILMTLAIDWLAGFWSGLPSSGQSYAGFVSTYFPGDYDGRSMWESLRNGLAHMFTLKDVPKNRQRQYALTHRHPQEHLGLDQGGRTRLDVTAFYGDWKAAKLRYLNDVRQEAKLLMNWHKRFSEFGFLALSPSRLAQAGVPTAEGVISTAASYSVVAHVAGQEGYDRL